MLMQRLPIFLLIEILREEGEDIEGYGWAPKSLHNNGVWQMLILE